MKLVLLRFIAVLLLVIPGLLATYGFLEIKDAIYEYIVLVGETDSGASFPWLHLIWGILCFGAGVCFIGGWIFYRDRKRNYLAPRFKEKK